MWSTGAEILQYSSARSCLLQGRNFQLRLKIAGSLFCAQAASNTSWKVIFASGEWYKGHN